MQCLQAAIRLWTASGLIVCLMAISSCIRYVLASIVMFSGNALAGSHWLHRLSDVLADGLVCYLPRTHTIEASHHLLHSTNAAPNIKSAVRVVVADLLHPRNRCRNCQYGFRGNQSKDLWSLAPHEPDSYRKALRAKRF